MCYRPILGRLPDATRSKTRLTHVLLSKCIHVNCESFLTDIGRSFRYVGPNQSKKPNRDLCPIILITQEMDQFFYGCGHQLLVETQSIKRVQLGLDPFGLDPVFGCLCWVHFFARAYTRVNQNGFSLVLDPFCAHAYTGDNQNGPKMETVKIIHFCPLTHETIHFWFFSTVKILHCSITITFYSNKMLFSVTSHVVLRSVKGCNTRYSTTYDDVILILIKGVSLSFHSDSDQEV